VIPDHAVRARTAAAETWIMRHTVALAILIAAHALAAAQSTCGDGNQDCMVRVLDAFEAARTTGVLSARARGWTGVGRTWRSRGRGAATRAGLADSTSRSRSSRLLAPRSRANPKSRITGSRSAVTMMLPGLMSRWMITASRRKRWISRSEIGPQLSRNYRATRRLSPSSSAR